MNANRLRRKFYREVVLFRRYRYIDYKTSINGRAIADLKMLHKLGINPRTKKECFKYAKKSKKVDKREKKACLNSMKEQGFVPTDFEILW